jgi:hypothetical protein
MTNCKTSNVVDVLGRSSGKNPRHAVGLRHAGDGALDLPAMGVKQLTDSLQLDDWLLPRLNFRFVGGVMGLAIDAVIGVT